MQAFGAALHEFGIWLRQLGAIILLFLSIRLLWLSGTLGVSLLSTSAASSGAPSSVAAQPYGQSRPELEDLLELAGSSRDNAPDNGAPMEDAPVDGPRLRRILVDLGPERSDVYVNGQRVGQTPFGGQVSCSLDEILKVQVLPARGIPLERTVVCRGDTLVIQR